jgi:glutathione synthase/RimK-type ligase-like ATP-grasp enzyme
VYLAELLARHGLPIPKTLIVHRGTIGEAASLLGLPCVLKRPDSSLSLGVVKAETEAEVEIAAAAMFAHSALIVAQEYLPTSFDWRVGILEGRPLFVCKYHMVPDHWQILRHDASGGHYEEGPTEALRVEDAPRQVIVLALRAAALIGHGFYGVDIKQVGDDDFRIIEINDNPNVDAGNEDGVAQDDVYRGVMAVFARRMAENRRAWP